MGGEVEEMQTEWDERAKRDVMTYLKDDSSLEEYLESGEPFAQRLIDPILEDWNRYPGDGEGDTVALDIGCGIGRTTKPLSRRFDRAIGVDVSTEMIEQARQLHGTADALEFRTTNGTDFEGIESDSITYAFSYEVFPHVPSESVIERNVSQLARVLSTDGLCQLHFRLPAAGWVEPFGIVPIPEQLARLVPSSVKQLYHFLDGNEAALQKERDPLKNTDTWDGVSPSLSRVHDIFTSNGFERVYFWPDPMYPPGARAFCVAEGPK